MPPPLALMASLRTTVLLAFMAAAGVLACSSDSSDPDGDDARVTACTGLSLATASGQPGDEVGIGTLPADFEEPYAARVLSGDGGATGYALITVDDNGNASLVVPIHPSSPLDGGPLQLAVGDGVFECAPFDFDVQALPEAPGELDAIVQALAALVEADAALLGTTTAELAATDPASLPLVYQPLAVVNDVLRGAGNDYSLAALVDGTSPGFDAEGRELAERLLARTGLRSELESAAVPNAAEKNGPPPVDDPDVSCTPEFIGSDPARLDPCMALALSVTLSLEGFANEVLDDIGLAFSVAGLIPVPQVEVATAVVGLAVYVVQARRERLAGLLPSSFAEMTVDWGQTDWREDALAQGDFTQAEVLATNDGWDMAKTALEGVLAAAGYLRTMEKFGGAEAVNDVVALLVTSGLIPLLLGDETLDTFQVPPVEFGPVSVMGEEWAEARVVTGDAVQFTSFNIYELNRAGTSTISVRTEDGKFGGQQIARSTVVTVGELDIDVDPEEIFVVPNEIVFFEVTVIDSDFPEAVALVEGQTWQGDADVAYEGDNRHILSYTAPSSPDASEPDVISIYHTITHGARAGGVPRTATATVRFGGVRIRTDPGCVEPGAEPFGIDLEIFGRSPPVDLIWSATAGVIDDNATFTPPQQSQYVTITVAFADQPAIRDEITFPVGGCSCTGSISVDGATTALEHLIFNIDGGGVATIRYFGSGPSGGGLSFGADQLTSQPVPIGQTGTFDALGSGSLTGTIWSNLGEDNENTLPPLSVTLQENTGSLLVGSAVGAVEVMADPEPIVQTLTFTFSIEADPDFSDDERKFCETVEPDL